MSIEAILEVTTNLFFIQTRIDQFRKEQWQELQQRNEQVLRERFGEKLADARVWPISSTNLMKAAETGDPDYEIVSRHRELAAALKTFLFRVAGWSRVAAAMVVAGHYYGSAKQVLSGRVADLVEQSKERRTEVQQQVAQRKQQFDSEWGERGPKRQELMAALQRATGAGKRALRQALERGGQIDMAARAKIDRVTSIEEAQRLAQTLAEEVAQGAVKKWQEVDQQVRKYCLEQLEPFLEAMEHLAQASYAGAGTASPAQERYELQTQDDWFEKAKGARLDFMQASAIAGIGGAVALVGLGVAASSSTLVATLVASAAFPPLAIGAAIAAGVWAIFQGRKGWMRVKETQVKRAQQELYKFLGEVRDRARRYYFDVDLGSGRLQSLVDEHFDQQVRGIGDHLQRLAHQKSEEARLELARLTEQAKLDEQQRAARLAELRARLAQWEKVGHAIQGIIKELEGLEQSLVGAGKPAVEEKIA
jgi:hypothetical protein